MFKIKMGSFRKCYLSCYRFARKQFVRVRLFEKTFIHSLSPLFLLQMFANFKLFRTLVPRPANGKNTKHKSKHTHIHKVEPKTLYFNFVWLLQNRFLLSISRKWKAYYYLSLSVSRAVSQVIIRVHKPHGSAQLNPKGAPWLIIITTIKWLST